MNARFSLIVAGLAGASGMALGAFGSHALQGWLPTGLLRAWETAVDYQFVHTLALLGIAVLQTLRPGLKSLSLAAIAFTTGIVVFSGSLYILALTQITLLGMITPIGGVAFMLGWMAILVAAWRWEASP